MSKINAYLFFSLLVFIGSANAIDGKVLLNQQCVSCHNVTGPAAQTVDELWKRLGPDLFQAGSKYNAAWMESWLVKPTRIRPAGYHAVLNIKPGEKRDIVNEASLKQHAALGIEEAKAVTQYLMTLKAPDELIQNGAYKPGKISLNFGEMVFDKFNGCMACHQIEPGYGGLSGPEVYTAAKRLQPDYLVSFISNPQAWNPKSPMPNKHTSPPNVQKLVHYLIGLSKENWHENE